jgi:Dual specificity phosphatase, catalytic domain
MKNLRRGLLVLLLLGCLGVWLWFLRLERAHREEPYSRIEEGLYVGAHVPEPPPGTGAVLNLCDVKDAYEVGTYLHEPILDAGKAPSIEWLRRIVEFVDRQRRADVTTYIHCAAGKSRSGLVVTAYLMRKHDWSRDRALAFVRSKRPEIQPNPAFMELLAEWEQVLKE